MWYKNWDKILVQEKQITKNNYCTEPRKKGYTEEFEQRRNTYAAQ